MATVWVRESSDESWRTFKGWQGLSREVADKIADRYNLKRKNRMYWVTHDSSPPGKDKTPV